MMSDLKRKQKSDYSLSKRKFEEDLNSIVETPVPKPKPKPKAQRLNEAPELIFKEIFDKNQRNSSGFCIKYKPKHKKPDRIKSPDTSTGKKINLSEIYSSIVPETKKDIKLIEKLQEHLIEADEDSNENSSQDSDVHEEAKAIQLLCCTPSEHTIKIPESYRRQRPIKSKPLQNT